MSPLRFAGFFFWQTPQFWTKLVTSGLIVGQKNLLDIKPYVMMTSQDPISSCMDLSSREHFVPPSQNKSDYFQIITTIFLRNGLVVLFYSPLVSTIPHQLVFWTHLCIKRTVPHNPCSEIRYYSLGFLRSSFDPNLTYLGTFSDSHTYHRGITEL